MFNYGGYPQYNSGYNPYSQPNNYAPMNNQYIPQGQQSGNGFNGTAGNSGANIGMPSHQYYYVNGIEGAKGYIIYPNTTVMLMDSDRSVFYIKSANAQGQSTLKAYEFTEIDENGKRDVPNLDTSNFADKSDIKQLEENMLRKFEEIKNSLTNVPSAIQAHSTNAPVNELRKPNGGVK